jgi:hypothetical protein
MPTIDVDGVGRLAFPVLPAQAERLIAVAEGKETVVDREVRRTWQVDSSKVRIGGTQAGLATTLPYLEDLAVRWERRDTSIQSPLWHEADALSGHMLRSWPRSSWRADDGAQAGRMLDLQIRLGNVERINAFLSAEGHYAASDNGAIVRAAAVLPPARATDPLVPIVRRNASANLAACGDLLLRCVGAGGRSGADRRSLDRCVAGDPAKRKQLDTWTRPTPVKPGFVVDLLTATSRIDAGSRRARSSTCWPGRRHTSPTTCWSPLLSRLPSRRKARRVRQRRGSEKALSTTRHRIALPLEAPRDWTRTNPLKCTCGDYRGLGRSWLHRISSNGA